MRSIVTLLSSAGLLAIATAATAQDVNITPDMKTAEISFNGQTIVIERSQDTEARLEGDFTKTSRQCPPFCIHPMSAGEGVETVGEVELIAFLENQVAAGTGLLIDSRIPAWHKKGTIPGAINIPFSTLSPDNTYRERILQALGAKENDGDWDFTDATDLMLFCNGPWCDQSPRAIQYLLAAGYPSEKLRYYRGGMQLWLLLGLNTAQEPTS